MNPPVFDDTEPVYVYMQKLEDYNTYLKREKYMSVLNFINETTKKSYKSLCDFKNVSLKDFKSETDNLNTLKLKGEKLAKSFKFTYDFDTKDKDMDHVIKFIGKLVKAINFTFSIKLIGKNSYYTIFNKAPPKTSVKS